MLQMNSEERWHALGSRKSSDAVTGGNKLAFFVPPLFILILFLLELLMRVTHEQLSGIVPVMRVQEMAGASDSLSKGSAGAVLGTLPSTHVNRVVLCIHTNKYGSGEGSAGSVLGTSHRLPSSF